MATFQPYGLEHHQPPLCSKACLWQVQFSSSALLEQLLCRRTTPCPCRHDGQGLAPLQVWLQHKVPPIHLDGSTKHFYSLQEIGRNQQNWALYSSRLVSTVGCFQGCRHRGIKENTTMVLHDPLSVYITFSFSAFARKY